MNPSESFETAATAFHAASGRLAPGKDGCIRTPECLHDWKIWCAAVEYMKEHRPPPMTERRYSVDDGSVTVLLPEGYSTQSVQDLIDHLEIDKQIQEREASRVSHEG